MAIVQNATLVAINFPAPNVCTYRLLCFYDASNSLKTFSFCSRTNETRLEAMTSMRNVKSTCVQSVELRAGECLLA